MLLTRTNCAKTQHFLVTCKGTRKLKFTLLSEGSLEDCTSPHKGHRKLGTCEQKCWFSLTEEQAWEEHMLLPHRGKQTNKTHPKKTPTKQQQTKPNKPKPPTHPTPTPARKKTTKPQTTNQQPSFQTT